MSEVQQLSGTSPRPRTIRYGGSENVRLPECFAWFDGGPRLATWAAAHLLNRDDACTRYIALENRDGDQKTFTSKHPVTSTVLSAHFAGCNVGDLIGLHALSADGQCRWIALDIDNHGAADPFANSKYALHLYTKLKDLGFRPLLIDSDGRGGFHIWVVFASRVPANTANAFAKWLIVDAKDHGVKTVEVLPKQANRDGLTYGSTLRLPGRHHTHLGHWARAWDGVAWLSGHEAIDLIVGTTGDDTSLIPEIAAPPAPAPPPPPPSPESIAHIDQADRMKRAVAYVNKLPDSRSGERGHDALFAAARVAVQFGLDAEHARLLLDYYNKNKCHPTWDGPSLAHKQKDAYRVFVGELGIKLVGDDNGVDLEERAKRCSDVGNAARLIRRHGQNIRFVPPWKQWIIWTGKRWERDRTGRMVGLAKETVLAIYAEAQVEPDDAQRAMLAKHALTSQRRERINAMVMLAQDDAAILPDQLDADPLLINTQNGTFNVQTGELQAHSRSDFITQICRGSYSPNATAHVWEKFIARCFVSHPELVRYVQKVLGYAATGSVSEQVILFAHGAGSNGKSTLLGAAMNALADYAYKAPEGLLMSRRDSTHPCEIAAIVGKRLVVCSESKDGARFDTARLKDLTGETTGTTRGMGENFYDYKVSFKLFLMSNHLPVVTDTTEGFWRRLRLLPFEDAVSDAEKDRDLPRKLAAEVDGILTWLCHGAVLWHREGLGVPAKVADATRNYRDESDVLGAFIGECCVEGSECTVAATPLFFRYRDFMQGVGEVPVTQTRFGRALRERGFQSLKRGTMAWLGIRLRTDNEMAGRLGQGRSAINYG